MAWETIKHWLGPRTFASIFVSGVAGWTTLTNMQLLMDDPVAIGTVLAFLIAGLISWWIIGSDSYKAESRDITISSMKATLDDIVAKMPANPVDLPASLSNLAASSSGEIRSGVRDIVEKMRNFETEIKNSHTPFMSRLLPHDISESERRRVWQEDTENHVSLMQKQNAVFNADIRPSALAYRDEMRRRLGETSESNPDYKDLALEHGLLAGINPVSNAANYLEELARKLP